jgi:hypothetical protein
MIAGESALMAATAFATQHFAATLFNCVVLGQSAPE